MTYTVVYTATNGRQIATDHLTLPEAIKRAEKVAATKWREAKVWTESGRIVSRRTPLPRGMAAIHSATA